MQTYYKLSYVDKQVQNPEQRVCEDIPKFTKGLAELTGEWTNAIIDAGFYAYQLRVYSKTNKYTAAILGYVIGAGGLTGVLAPNFGKLFKRQQENEGEWLLPSALLGNVLITISIVRFSAQSSDLSVTL